MRFDTASELIWTADGTRFSGYRANGNEIGGPKADDGFQILFGTKDGQRAYLGWSDGICHCPGLRPTIVDIEIVSGHLVFTAILMHVPGRPDLFHRSPNKCRLAVRARPVALGDLNPTDSLQRKGNRPTFS